MAENIEEVLLPLRKIVKQRNHDTAQVPNTLEEHADKPLYILIALWCRQQKKWIDRQQISGAFAITERRATFQISYILRHSEIIQCQSRKARGDKTGRIRLQINVQKVELNRPSRKAEKTNKRSDAQSVKCREHRENLRWILTRQPPEIK